ncbi:hypothetical protein ETB97_009403 [Aspergillus alliaceus]|uniref:Uncharacterized protein n=1 Tax=Petromyces alliaceus TaxID=209559 RepID=A0A8H6A6N8_PETAA|nr:hypothetical protein ETB97_009403 [Aspergillus burnettii]
MRNRPWEENACGPATLTAFNISSEHGRLVFQSALDRFSEQGMLLLVKQADLQRTAALLILYRLEYPFGEGDDEAKTLSQSIVTDMEHCHSVAGQQPPNITLALLVAGAEAQDPLGRKHILSLISRIKGARFYPFISNLNMFLARIWASRDHGTTRWLFHLFEVDPELSIPLEILLIMIQALNVVELFSISIFGRKN